MDDKEIKKLENVLKLINGSVSADDLVEILETFIDVIKEGNEETQAEVSGLKAQIEDTDNKIANSASLVQSRMLEALYEAKGELEERLSQLQLKHGKDGEDGEDADEEAILRRLIKAIPAPLQGSPDTGEEIINKINNDDSVKINIDKVDGIEELKKEFSGKGVHFGNKAVYLFIDGVKKGLLNSFNIKAGTNVTIGHSVVNGLDTLTFNSTGGSGFTELPATGTVNGSNTVFTFTQVPTYIVVDGVWLKATDSNGGVQWSNVSTTITMVSAPNNSIYGVA